MSLLQGIRKGKKKKLPLEKKGKYQLRLQHIFEKYFQREQTVFQQLMSLPSVLELAVLRPQCLKRTRVYHLALAVCFSRFPFLTCRMWFRYTYRIFVRRKWDGTVQTDPTPLPDGHSHGIDVHAWYGGVFWIICQHCTILYDISVFWAFLNIMIFFFSN